MRLRELWIITGSQASHGAGLVWVGVVKFPGELAQ